MDSTKAKPHLFYGWVIVACVACASFARQGSAVATLSVFIAPMVAEFEWSRSAISGAVSLGGVMGALFAPSLGVLVDRIGSRAILLVSTLVASCCAFLLAGVEGLVGFYICFSLSRMVFTAPFEVGISTVVANWFVRKRGRAMAYVSFSAAISLAIMPLLAELAIDYGGWRMGWLTVGAAVLIVGALPIALFMRRRPEDMGLLPDGAMADDSPASAAETLKLGPVRDLTRAEAVRTSGFWLLMTFTGIAFCIQAGISLHQAPFLVEQGISSTIAATIVSTFSISAALGALFFGRLGDRFPIRAVLPVVGLQLALGALAMHEVDSAATGYGAAVLFGFGIGGLLTLPQVAFAIYFGRTHYGAIRGLALPAQVVGQASGPLLAGVMHDVTGSYHAALLVFAGLGCCAALVGAMAKRP
jgi:MFS transporter, OFA family, oxalate/formate antiporter